MRYFTVEEANAFIPALQAVFGRIEKLRLEVVRLVEELEGMGDRPSLSSSSVPDDLAEPVKLRRHRVVAALAEIRQLVAELESHGLVVKKLDGLVEFRSRQRAAPGLPLLASRRDQRRPLARAVGGRRMASVYPVDETSTPSSSS